ncbi:MAG TPA: PKD domain-containing protein [Thermoplasmata archaeon]|nr:PKD domain-containing protein [Thermoplasmata archaeon]
MTHAGQQPAGWSGGLAFDPQTGEMVFYGGCNLAQCPINTTWQYNGFYWKVVPPTSNGSPPALLGMGFAWDPQWDGILLAGGQLANGAATNQTWLFNSTGWHNETAVVNPPSDTTHALPAEAFASMAYDDRLGEMIAVNGCASANCTAAPTGRTFALGGPGGNWTDVGPTFTLGAAFPGSPTVGGFAGQMAYDPSLAEMLYFGGELNATTVQNSTWILNATGWYNVTSSTSGCSGAPATCYYPPATAYGAISWDGQLSEMVLFGGANGVQAGTNSTYVLGAGGWFPACLSVCPLALPSPENGGEIASNSSGVGLLLVEGRCSTSCTGDAWVYEVSPKPTLTRAVPNPSEVGVPVNIAASNTVGTGSGPSIEGSVEDGVGDANVTNLAGATFSTTFDFTGAFTYAAAGTFGASAFEVDFFGVRGTSAVVDVAVNDSLAATATGLPNPDEVGTTVDFSGAIAAGAGIRPYTYAWQFDDGNTSPAATPSQDFGKAGTYDVSVLITDGVGGSVRKSVNVTVYPKLSATASVGAPAAEAGVPLYISGTPSGGSGVYSSYRWDLGDGNTSSTRSVVHTYAKAANYTLTYTVTDSADFTAMGTGKLTVDPALNVSPIHASTTSPTTTTAVAFNVTVRNGSPPYNYAWNFQNGVVSTDPSPTHTFTAPGSYLVSVTVEDRATALVHRDLTIVVSAASTRPSLVGFLSQGIGLYTFSAALAAVAFLIVVVILRRRERRRGSEESPAEDGSAGPADGSPPTEDGRPSAPKRPP